MIGLLSPGTSLLEPVLTPHHSGFKFQTIALSVLCVTFAVQNLLNALLVLFPDASLVL